MGSFEVYLQLLINELMSVGLTIIFFLLLKFTPFKKLSKLWQQVIIGVCFGIVAGLNTEVGVMVEGVAANARDAAPLCAALFFGGPAGIIAGFFGGIHRIIYTFGFGLGSYSWIACSVSTFLAGIIGALLRKFIFEGKYPSPLFAAVSGVVVESLHLSIFLFTKINDVSRCLAIIQKVALPMIIANAFASFVAALFVMIWIIVEKKERVLKRTISQRFQSWLLLVVATAFVGTTVFVFSSQTNQAIKAAESTLINTLDDIENDIHNTSDESILEKARLVADRYKQDTSITMTTLASLFDVSEINVVQKGVAKDENGQEKRDENGNLIYTGYICASTNKSFLGTDMDSGEQAKEFNDNLLSFRRTDPNKVYHDYYIQDLRGTTLDESIQMKYAGISISDSSYIQIGYSLEKFAYSVAIQIDSVLKYRHIGNTGQTFIANYNRKIVDEVNGEYKEVGDIEDYGFIVDDRIPRTETYRSVIKVYNRATKTYSDTPSYYAYDEQQGFFLFCILPESEIFEARNESVYINSLMQIISFSILFVALFVLIKLLFVKKVRRVNYKLGQIAMGKLDTVVTEQSTLEFEMLSSEINATVGRLRQLINEEKTRIDKELEFAKSIQSSALPSVFPPYPDEHSFDIYATMDAAKQVGGDFYDLYLIDENHMAFLIADVSGKGIPAAMFMMQSKTLIKNLARINIPVNEVLTRANEALCQGNDAGMFITCWMGVCDLNTGHLTFANAGHNLPLIYRKDEGWSYLKQKVGFVLAGIDGFQYQIQELDLKEGDKIYLYTDGVTEATTRDSKLYGEQRLLDFLNSHKDKSPEETLHLIKEDIDLFVDGADQFDDITMLMFDFKGRE